MVCSVSGGKSPQPQLGGAAGGIAIGGVAVPSRITANRKGREPRNEYRAFIRDSIVQVNKSALQLGLRCNMIYAVKYT
ncbi:MAG: hypothetical protein K8G78_03605, partial [Deltaproteobacteria bacterium]|nr:hypothetical protein [Candidatus Kapabacteria bacterium]